jgi:hypothetical protein
MCAILNEIDIIKIIKHMTDIFESKRFKDIPLNDLFFDSLKKDYGEFTVWYQGKSQEQVYVQYTDGKLTGFMYPKLEVGEVLDVSPPFPQGKRIKIGTLKVEAHGTKLGERLIKKAFDHAIVKQAEEIYVTVFPRYKPLITLLEEFGFRKTGIKETENGVEDVLVKRFDHSRVFKEIRKDYPLIDTRNVNYYLLAIQPQWHSQLFPDSLLKTEDYDLLSDISHTNSISKTYICSMEGVEQLKSKDLLVIYRTSDNQGPAEYRSVATSVCVVEDVRQKRSFKNIHEFINYTKPFSVFEESELTKWWRRSELYVIKMLYNAAFTKKVIRRTLIEDVGLDRNTYWGFMGLSCEQFLKTVNLGGIDGRLVIH